MKSEDYSKARMRIESGGSTLMNIQQLEYLQSHGHNTTVHVMSGMPADSSGNAALHCNRPGLLEDTMNEDCMKVRMVTDSDGDQEYTQVHMPDGPQHQPAGW